MKKLIAIATLIASTSAFASFFTTSVTVFGDSAAEVKAEMMEQIADLNDTLHTTVINGQSCQNPKVYAASAPKMSYRVNAQGELEEQFTATFKVRCRD